KDNIVNRTIDGNGAAGRGISNGGGIYLFSTDPTLILNTIIAGNQADSGQQIAGDFTGTANIIQESIAGLLDPELKDNGGPTKTHALLSDSAAINAGDNIAATNAGLTTDQRGTGFSRIVSDIIDIGAFESSVVEPVDLVVSTTSDVVDGNYSPGLLSLREAIQLANSTSGADTISFDASLAGQTIVLTSELLISDHLTITGLGVDQLTISGDNDSRIFNIFDGQVDTLIDVEISGLTLTKGSSTQGGAIYNYENIVLTDTLFTENKASSEGAAIFSGQGSVSMSESRLSANIADRGAGIFAINSILTLDTSTFSGNTVTRDGSAIYNIFYTPSLELNPSTITGCTFVDNTAAGNGGGIYNSGGIIIVSDSTFSEQKAVLGGGIYSKTNGYTGNISVINSTFSNNTEVESGGGIYSDGVGLSVEDSFFTGNVVFGENTNGLGGGIYITGGSLTVTGTEFSDNVASRGGGGIYSGGNEFLTISASTFNRNQSRSGGGIFNNNTTLSILDSRFTENQALVTPGKEYLSAVGGAVFNSYAVATAAGEMDTLIANTEFTGNYADNAGAAIQQSFGFITINNSLITENLVGTSGSGIHNSFGQMTVHQSTISNNKSLGNGSGISNNGTLLLSESTVAGNIATYFGGGVYISSDGTTTISNSTLSGNQSARDGGALYANTNQPLSIINTTITGNSAVRGGGIRADNVIPALTNSIIAGNTADLEPQLYSNYTNVNSIVQDSIVGLLDPVLSDNGGPTKTHALLPGSAAIDAGDNTAATAAGLTTDQRGESSSRIVDGTVDIGAFEVQAPFAQVDLRIVSSETTTEDNGEVSALPANREWINEWGGYWLEIWISSPLATSQGIASVNFNLSYNTAVTTAVAIEYGAAFTIGQTGTINDHTGVIENLSAVTSLSDVGDDQPVLFARIRFESESADAVALDVEGQTLNPQSPSILVDSSEILFAGSAASEEVNGPAPETTIYANPFDLNDDELINYRDLMLFIRAFGTTPGQSSNHFAWAADYNQNGRVDFPDLLAMVFNFGKSKEGAIPIDYPANFPEAWNQLLTVETQQPLQTTAKSVTQATAETMLESAKAELSPQLDSEQRQVLSEVDIEVVELAAGTLG
ncbi:MAG TPA: hypothetical protein DCM07_31235, partial [Planctomycetaceae bacterium]|nr:hypothetical protein [Planctomycetaceae bacterium]